MAAKLMEIMEQLRERGIDSWVFADCNGWRLYAGIPSGKTHCFPIDVRIVNPYRSVEKIVEFIVKEVGSYGQS